MSSSTHVRTALYHASSLYFVESSCTTLHGIELDWTGLDWTGLRGHDDGYGLLLVSGFTFPPIILESAPDLSASHRRRAQGRVPGFFGGGVGCTYLRYLVLLPFSSTVHRAIHWTDNLSQLLAIHLSPR